MPTTAQVSSQQSDIWSFSESEGFLLFCAVTGQHSAAMHYYLQAGAVSSDFFTKAVPPEVYTDQVHNQNTQTGKRVVVD